MFIMTMSHGMEDHVIVNVYLERQRLVLVPVMLPIMDLHVREFVD
jgi:hypothetical protein